MNSVHVFPCDSQFKILKNRHEKLTLPNKSRAYAVQEQFSPYVYALCKMHYHPWTHFHSLKHILVYEFESSGSGSGSGSDSFHFLYQHNTMITDNIRTFLCCKFKI